MNTVCKFLLACWLAMPAFENHADEIVPGDNLVVEGIPNIPRSLAEDVSRYSEFRRARFLDWHPVRKEMLIATRLGNTYQLHHVKFPGGARTQLTFYDDNVFAGRYQPAYGRYFVFGKDVGGNEQYQNYRYDLDTGSATLLTDGKSRNTLGVWSRGGDRIAYTSTRRNGRDADLYTVDPADPKSDRLLAPLEGGGWSPLAWSPDERRILLQEYVSINEASLWVVDSDSGTKILATPTNAGEKVAYGYADFSRDGKGFYVITDAGSEFRRLAYFDLTTRQMRFLSGNLRGDVDDFDLSADRKKIAFVTNEEGTSKLYLLDLSTRRVRSVPTVPLGVIG